MSKWFLCSPRGIFPIYVAPISTMHWVPISLHRPHRPLCIVMLIKPIYYEKIFFVYMYMQKDYSAIRKYLLPDQNFHKIINVKGHWNYPCPPLETRNIAPFFTAVIICFFWNIIDFSSTCFNQQLWLLVQ